MSSSKRSSSSTSTNQTDSRTAATDQAIAIGAGANPVFNITDGGALDHAFALAAGVVEGAGALAEGSLAVAARSQETSLDLADRVNQGPENNLIETGIKVSAVVAVAAVVAFGLRKIA